MKVTVTEQEVNETARLLEEIRQWLEISKIDKEYTRGKVTFAVDGTAKETCVSVSTGGKLGSGADRAAELAFRMRALVATRVSQLANEVIDMLTESLPIPVEVRR